MFMPTPPGGMGEKKELDGGQGGPPAKRLKTEENLIPEGQFLARYQSPVTFKVTLVSCSVANPDDFLSGSFLEVRSPNKNLFILNSNFCFFFKHFIQNLFY